ncbi:L1 protein [Rusa timorensis papillomavirus 1]|uniref:Major capsid protein L1 n=1 Tax=Rusa timorensis papillomavirus 1 TaxID=2847277 RepID=A0A109PMF8_9PAPI|nr:L1 protein [Rusa timorensis papillomavirus 1]ALX18468.1 L1 protein [Rusa timorensis papillomavirus 1]
MTSFWLPSKGKLYLPPPTPITKVLHTDDFVSRTNIYYHAKSDRLLTVGNPYYTIKQHDKLVVPKVSGNQYRVFRVSFPDPNKFALADPKVYDPDKERLVWGVRGVEIRRGQPLGVGTTGHPFLNKVGDTENPSIFLKQGKDDRQNVSFDPKQIQLFVLGCTPCEGEHWGKATPCSPVETGDCPPIELKSTLIEDGDMCDIGFGCLDFKELQVTKSGVSLDIVQSTCKYPDFLKMCDDNYGNACFFFAKREQLFMRHFWTRGGVTGDDVPTEDYFTPDAGEEERKTMGPVAYFGAPSGSLVSSDSQLFNRPYWLQRAQGQNNGIAWNNQVFVTVVDNTRGTNFQISVPKDEEEHETFDAQNYKQYNRHVEEYELAFIVQLCKVSLEPEVLAHLNAMNKDILEDWELGFIAPPGSLEDRYRFMESLATRCPLPDQTKDKKDPYEKLNFWNVDLREKFSLELEQYSLGRKFLFQSGLRNGTKRPATKTVRFQTSPRPAKRRRKATS